VTGVSLEQRKEIPKSSYDLPRDETYIRLGCAGCSNAVCFTAKGVEFMLRDSDESKDLTEIVGEVGRHTDIQQGFSVNIYPTTERCEGIDGECPETENIDLVVELLNDRFGATLSAPQAA
jgi:hypothetical protein